MSLLVLLVTALATDWLSAMTARGPSLAQQMEAIGGRRPLPPPAVAHAVTAHTQSSPHRRSPHAAPATWPVPARLPAQLEAAALPATAVSPRYLAPLQMPPETARYASMRRHHYGRVVLGVRLDPAGSVAGLWLEQPSGDGVLDRYALQRVREWRFAPPLQGADIGLLALRFEASPR